MLGGGHGSKGEGSQAPAPIFFAREVKAPSARYLLGDRIAERHFAELMDVETDQTPILGVLPDLFAAPVAASIGPESEAAIVARVIERSIDISPGACPLDR